jgi:hypothetical protein
MGRSGSACRWQVLKVKMSTGIILLSIGLLAFFGGVGLFRVAIMMEELFGL